MASLKVGRVSSLVLLYCLTWITAYQIPNVSIEPLKPKGIRVSIPGDKKIGLFVFQGNINKSILNNDVGDISGEVIASTNGRLSFDNRDVELKPGDVINYYVNVVYERQGYIADNLVYTVPEPGPEINPRKPGTTECAPTLTRVRIGTACAGQVLLEDNFERFEEELWQLEQYIPGAPEFPFVSYQIPPQAPSIKIENGFLNIVPALQQNLAGFTNESIYSGSLDLVSGCTGPASSCTMNAWGASILPPIVSGRITSKSFAFTYGVIEIRAKLPQGDWLYPDLLLTPFINKYGDSSYASGVLRVAGALGNKQFTLGSVEYGSKVLYGGPIMDLTCRDSLLVRKVSPDDRSWNEDFHVYGLIWSPDRLIFMIDGEEWARVEPAASGLQGRFPATCDLPRQLLRSGTKMAPFDDYFYLTLGVAAGGVTEFPDSAFSGNSKPKPWINRGRKASLSFWNDMNTWLPTWRQPALVVDYVKIRAL